MNCMYSIAAMFRIVSIQSIYFLGHTKIICSTQRLSVYTNKEKGIIELS